MKCQEQNNEISKEKSWNIFFHSALWLVNTVWVTASNSSGTEWARWCNHMYPVLFATGHRFFAARWFWSTGWQLNTSFSHWFSLWSSVGRVGQNAAFSEGRWNMQTATKIMQFSFYNHIILDWDCNRQTNWKYKHPKAKRQKIYSCKFPDIQPPGVLLCSHHSVFTDWKHL